MIYGITGIFGSGKSTVAKLFTGYTHIDLDKVGHVILNKPSVQKKVVATFGREIITSGKIDRSKLKKIVFNNHKQLKKLNKITHPEILKEAKKRAKKHTILEGALLIEAKALSLVDKLIVVKVDKESHVSRLKKKKKYSDAEISHILKSQLSQREKLKYADFIIDNTKTIAHAKRQVQKLL